MSHHAREYTHHTIKLGRKFVLGWVYRCSPFCNQATAATVRKYTAGKGVLFVALALGSVYGCDNSDAVLQLRREVETLKAQVTALEQRTDELDAIKTELASARSVPTPAPLAADDVRPITPAQYTPDGSEVDDPYLGRPDAQLLFMEFADYQCKPCAQFYQNTFRKIRQEYVDSGKIKFVYRDFPLASNPFASAAARVAQCAGEQGLYWEMHSYLFENAELVRLGSLDQADSFSARVDKDKFRNCTKSTRYIEEVSKDTEDGTRLGVRGAPAFFIGKKAANGRYSGVLVRGAQPIGVFRAEIAKLLDK